MKGFTAVVIASYLAVASAVPQATPASNDVPCGAAVAAAPPPPPTPSCLFTVLTINAATPSTAPLATASPAAAPDANVAAGTNVQTFTGSLGGLPPPVIKSSGDRPFSVNGDTFVGINAALGRSCDVQHNACANAANFGSLSGGVGQCDEQNQACHSANNLRRRRRAHPRDIAATPVTTNKRAALDLGTCSNAAILFEPNLDGRTTNAFIAANQNDFNHGSALNIAVIAGFICQRLDSSCKASSDTQAACAQASSAAVAATQDQSAADAWNAIMASGGGGDVPAAVATPAQATVTPAPDVNVSPAAPAVQVLTFSHCF